MSRSALEAIVQGRRGGSFLSQKIDEKKRLQESISSHKTGLPDRLLRLFAARPAPPHVEHKRKRPPPVPLSGVAAYLDKFAGPEDEEYEPPVPETWPPEPRLFRNPELAAQARVDWESKPEKDVRVATERREAAKQQQEEGLSAWDPQKDPNAEVGGREAARGEARAGACALRVRRDPRSLARGRQGACVSTLRVPPTRARSLPLPQGDPFKTLFVSRLSYEVTERKLRREFEEFGPIKRIRLVHDKNSGKPKGYAFVEYEHKNDMKQAYKMADGRKIEGRRCLVDVERGRTVPNWRPRRLGGGKGGEAREGRPPKDVRRQFELRLIQRWQEEKSRERSKEREEGEVGGSSRRESRRDDDRSHDRRAPQLGDRDYRRDSGRERERDRDRDYRKRERYDDDRGGDERRYDKRPRERERDA
eukprot:scaffold6.g2503.t1